MLFILKKVIGALLLPLPLLLLNMGIAIILLWFTRWQKTGKGLFSVSWLVLLLISLQPVADWMLRPIENHYTTRQSGDSVHDIVVLGGGYTWNPRWAPSSNIINNSLPRLTEAIRLKNLNPGARLIFTGAKTNGNPVSTAEAGARVSESLGIPRNEIVTLDTPKDTEEEALAVANFLGTRPFILVTSASHLPRAMLIFTRAGLNPLPAPAAQLAIASPLNFWEKAIPSPSWLVHSDRVSYETLGQIWLWLKHI